MTPTQFRPIFARVMNHFNVSLESRRVAWEGCYDDKDQPVTRVIKTYITIYNTLKAS